MPTKDKRIRTIRGRRNRLLKLLKSIRASEKGYVRVVELLNKRIARLKQLRVPASQGGWHPDAMRTQVQSGLGAPLNVPAKLVWHTTEGTSLPTYSGSHPHFTLNPRSGELWQHIPINSGAMSLKNAAGGIETNRANAKQVELIGFARDTQNWSDAEYARIAKLARWIEKHGGVARKCSVEFKGNGATPHISGAAWVNYSGHIGHQHVPENDHWDPGAFRINKVL